MQLLPIDDHVPLPTPWHDTVEIDIVTHTLRALNVGQSFAVPAEEAIANVQKGGGHFTMRKLPDGSYRVWRER